MTIKATLTLDTKNFADGLNKALGSAKGFSSNLQGALNTPLKSPTGGKDATNELNAQREAVREGISALRDYELQLRRGEISQETFVQGARSLEAVFESNRAELDQTSKGYGLYTNALNTTVGRIERVTAAQNKAAQAAKATADGVAASGNRTAAAQDKVAKAQERVNQSLRSDRVRQYRDEMSRLQATFERDRDRTKFVKDMEALRSSMERFRTTLSPATKEIGALDRALGTSTRNINTAQGRISALGLSQQFAVGSATQFAQSLAFAGGVAGGPATLGITAMSGALAGVTVGAAVAGAAILGLVTGTALLVQRGIPQVKEYQKAMNVLAASGETDIGRFRAELTALQQEGGKAAQAFSRAQLAGALAETVKAGVDANDALKLLATGTQLASAENEDLATSTSLVLQNLRQFGLGVDEATRAGDALAKAGLLAVGTARDLSEGLATVGPVAKVAGLSIEETLGLLVNLDNKGLKAAEEGATGLRSVLAQLGGPSGPGVEAIEALGVSIRNLDGSLKPVKQRLFEVRDAIRESGLDLTYFANIADTRALTALLALDESTDAYTEAIFDSKGELTSYAEYLSQGLSPAQARAKASFDDLAATTAEVFAPAIGAAAQKVAELVRQLDDAFSRSGSFSNKLKSLFGVSDASLLEADLARVTEQLRGLREQSELMTAPARSVLGIQLPSLFGSPEQAAAKLAENERLITEFEAQAEDLQQRLNALIPGPNDYVIPQIAPPPGDAPIAPIDPARLAEYEASLRAFQASAAQAQISAMKDGAAKIQKQRDYDLIVARLAFEEQTEGLQEGSELLIAFQEVYDQQRAAIMARGTAALEKEYEARVKAAQALVNDIEKLRTDVAVAEAEASGDIVAAITARSAAAGRQLEQERQTMLARIEDNTEESRAQILEINASFDAKERGLAEQLTRDLTTEAQRRASTLQSLAERTASVRAQTRAAGQRDQGDETGAVQTELNERLAEIQRGLDREVAVEGRAQAEITALHTQANAERVAARQDAARQTEAIVKAEADTAKAVLEASAKSLQQAQLAGVEGVIPQLRANFQAEQSERRANNAKTLEDFTGTAAERQRLIQDQGQTETILTRQNQLQVNRAAQEGQEAYLQAVKDYNRQVVEAQQAARQQEIANQQAILEARRAAAEGQVGSSDTGTQAAGYKALIAVQKETVTLAKQVTAAERQRGASAAEIITALNAEAEAQRGVTTAIEGQIDKLKSLRDEQVGVIQSGAAVLEYAKLAAELGGGKLGFRVDPQNAADALVAEQRAQLDLLRIQKEQNAPVQERLETLKAIQRTEEELKKLGRSALRDSDRRLIGFEGSAALAEYPAQAAEALKQTKSLDEQIAELGTQLTTATTQLTDLLTAAGSDAGLDLQVNVVVDKTGLEQAQKALADTFGEDAANSIIAQADKLGADAGLGFMEAISQNVISNEQLLTNAIKRVFANVDQYLPHSDARKGPFSRLSHAGRAIPQTMASGVSRGSSALIGAVSSMASKAQPSFNIPTSRAMPPMAGAYAGGMGPQGDTIINVGNSALPTSSITAGAARQFAQTAVNEARLIIKRGG